MNRRELVVGTTAAGVLTVAGCSSDSKRGGSPGDQGPAGSGGFSVLADTAATVSRWSCVQISGVPTGETAHRVGVDAAQQLTITSGKANTRGNRREIWTPGGTHTDVEVHCVVQPTEVQTFAARHPQVGLALRVQDHDDGTTSAFIVDTNVSGNSYTELWCSLWQWPTGGDPATPDIDDASDTLLMTEKVATITSTQRADVKGWADFVTVDHVPAEWVPGDTVRISCTSDGFTRSSANVLAAATTSSTLVAHWPAIVVAAPSGETTAVDWAAATGDIRQAVPSGATIAPKAYYPMHVVARALGSTLSIGAWPVGEPDRGARLVVDFADTGYHLPTEGRVGVLANHLQGGHTITYSDITVRDLDTGA